MLSADAGDRGGPQGSDLRGRVGALTVALARQKQALAGLAAYIAEVEELVADVFDARARTSVNRAVELHEFAAEARRYAEVERAQAARFASSAPD